VSEQIEETCAGVSTRDLIASQTRVKSLSGSLVNQFVKNLPLITSHRRSIGLRSGECAGKYMGIILKTAVAGLKMPDLLEITLAFEFLVLTLTVPGLRSKNFKSLRAFAYLHHFHSP
jgi:hypothetical protein